MHTHAVLVVTVLAPALGCLPAQEIRGIPKTPAATTLQATLAAPAAKVAVGSPITLEVTLTTSGPWHGTWALAWERHHEVDGSWVPFVNKTPPDPSWWGFAGATTVCLRRHEEPNVLFHLTPGRWRAQARLWWPDVDDKEHQTTSGWCEIEIVDHAGNQAAMRDTRHGFFTPWLSVVGRSMPTDDFPIPPELQGFGMVPKGTPMADAARAIAAMRDAGVSSELVLAADLILLRRDVWRVHNMAAGAAQQEAARQARTRIEALAKANPIAATPLGGQHGEVLQLLATVLRLEAPERAEQLIATVRQTRPMLADHLGRDLPW